ncbi:MAG: phosphoenolpyruvate carboxykinase (ATP) [Caldisericia bacterium]|nr:phosphoenolpyruvate carboxykinase (ATP) [Caldisericia bacterium]
MATVRSFARSAIGPKNPQMNIIKTTIETAFYGNNVESITSLPEAYQLAMQSPGTVVTDLPVFKPEAIGLEIGTKVLLFNDGEVTGRCAAARRIVGEPEVNVAEYAAIIREAVYESRYKTMYHAQTITGLHEDFMVRNHLLIPEDHENILYNWMLNFQVLTPEYFKLYANSRPLPETDIYVFSDPDWKHEKFPLGLSFFDPQHNCAAILGMRYFGEFKKGTLTLAWGIANRNGYASCHGGQKRYQLQDGSKKVIGVFGLSGSGKSTLTHAKHDNKYDVTVLHDDAFVISSENGSSVALEPSYFDKTSDYPCSSPDNKFLITLQNCGATIDEDEQVVLVTEDLRNGNGRAIKSKLWSPNRVDKLSEPINAIIWLMKDPTLPPVIKISGSALASAFGATLATKRTSAERLAPGIDPNALVIEPYANPFRTYPLAEDFEKFKFLFANRNVDCYIFNTGFFMDKKINKEVTLKILEDIVENKANFNTWQPFQHLSILPIDGFVPNMQDRAYVEQLKERMKDRLRFLESRDTFKGGFDKLPPDAIQALKEVVSEIEHQ